MTSGARLLLDEMLSPTIGEQLSSRGLDVAAVAHRPDLVHLPDEEILARAMQELRTVVTRNIGDFTILDRQWSSQHRSHAGIVYVSTSTFPEDRSFVGAVVASLVAAARDGALPGTDETRFLRRRS